MRAAHYASTNDIFETVRNTVSETTARTSAPAGGEPPIPLGTLARNAVERWCSALPARHYLVAVRDERGGRPAHAHLTAPMLLGSLGWLRHRNALGAGVVARPWATGHILVDGLTPVSLERLAAEHEPAVVVEAGLGLMQAWVTVADDGLEPALAGVVARHLATRYGGLTPTASARALGRLPGFTHPAAQRHPDGRPRFLRVVSTSPGVHRAAADLVDEARAELARTGGAHRAPPGARRCRCDGR
jgi:hypothetical protein